MPQFKKIKCSLFSAQFLPLRAVDLENVAELVVTRGEESCRPKLARQFS